MEEISQQMANHFQKGFDINEELKESSLSTNATQFQTKVSEAMKALEMSTHLVNELSIFSTNESVEEIETKNLKYLLLPALLADLTLKSQTTERSEVLKTAEIYFNDFIQRLNDYQICDIEIKHSDSDVETKEEKSGSTGASMYSSLESAVLNRNDKILRYKAMKDMENKMKALREQMRQSDDGIDDEILRDYYLTLLKHWINHSLEELKSIETEKPIVEHLKQMKAQNKDNKHVVRNPKSETSRPLKPMIITRNEMQKKVYGLGYPSIPTVSVDDFVNQKLEEGSLAITDPNIYSNNLIDWAENPDKKLLEDEREEDRKEMLIERDDIETLMRARGRDNFKDEHKRGEGNRKNMG